MKILNHCFIPETKIVSKINYTSIKNELINDA